MYYNFVLEANALPLVGLGMYGGVTERAGDSSVHTKDESSCVNSVVIQRRGISGSSKHWMCIYTSAVRGMARFAMGTRFRTIGPLSRHRP